MHTRTLHVIVSVQAFQGVKQRFLFFSIGNWKDGGGIPSASKPGLQSRKALSTKQVTLLGAENPGLSAKTPGPAAKTPGRRALGDITNAGQGSKAAKTPKLKAEGLRLGQTPARKVSGNITNQGPAQLQKKAEQGVSDGLAEKPAGVKEVGSTRERKAVRRTANGRRIVPGVNFRLTAEEKAKIREMASSLAETGVEHVHVTGRQLEEMRIRDEERGERRHAPESVSRSTLAAVKRLCQGAVSRLPSWHHSKSCAPKQSADCFSRWPSVKVLASRYHADCISGSSLSISPAVDNSRSPVEKATLIICAVFVSEVFIELRLSQAAALSSTTTSFAYINSSLCAQNLQGVVLVCRS
jgi:hypothetical protein